MIIIADGAGVVVPSCHAHKNSFEHLAQAKKNRVRSLWWSKPLEIRVKEKKEANAAISPSCVQKSIGTWSCRLTTQVGVQLLLVLRNLAGTTFAATTFMSVSLLLVMSVSLLFMSVSLPFMSASLLFTCLSLFSLCLSLFTCLSLLCLSSLSHVSRLFFSRLFHMSLVSFSLFSCTSLSVSFFLLTISLCLSLFISVPLRMTMITRPLSFLCRKLLPLGLECADFGPSLVGELLASCRNKLSRCTCCIACGVVWCYVLCGVVWCVVCE